MDKILPITLEEINLIVARASHLKVNSEHQRYSIIHAKKLIDMTLERWKEYFPVEDYEALQKLSVYLDEELGVLNKESTAPKNHSQYPTKEISLSS